MIVVDYSLCFYQNLPLSFNQIFTWGNQMRDLKLEINHVISPQIALEMYFE